LRFSVYFPRKIGSLMPARGLYDPFPWFGVGEGRCREYRGTGIRTGLWLRFGGGPDRSRCRNCRLSASGSDRLHEKLSGRSAESISRGAGVDWSWEIVKGDKGGSAFGFKLAAMTRLRKDVSSSNFSPRSTKVPSPILPNSSSFAARILFCWNSWRYASSVAAVLRQVRVGRPQWRRARVVKHPIWSLWQLSEVY